MAAILPFLEQFGLTFIPLFVAMDPVGTTPIYLSLTRGVEAAERPKVLKYAFFTALGIGLAFLLFGKLIFLVLGITVADFLIAGGLILLLLATTELVMSVREESPRYA